MSYRSLHLLAKLQQAFNDDDVAEAHRITKELIMDLQWTGVDYV